MPQEYTSVSIPKPLYNKVKGMIKDSGFTSVSDFVTFILREILADANLSNENTNRQTIIERLRALGYID